MKIAQIVLIVACVVFIAWMGKMLYHVFETRQEFANVLQSTSTKQEHNVAEIMQVKRLHRIQVETALASFALFVGVSIVTVIEMRARRRATSRWHWISLGFAILVAATSLWSVGNISWNTFPLEFILTGQVLAAALVAAVCGTRLVFRSDSETQLINA